jgi:hypothetical protein
LTLVPRIRQEIWAQKKPAISGGLVENESRLG